MQSKLRELLSGKANTLASKEDIPSFTSNSLVAHALTTTSNIRNFMERNPKKRQPNDFKLFPGKMDHATSVSLKVDNYGAPLHIAHAPPPLASTSPGTQPQMHSAPAAPPPPPPPPPAAHWRAYKPNTLIHQGSIQLHLPPSNPETTLIPQDTTEPSLQQEPNEPHTEHTQTTSTSNTNEP